MSLDFNNKNSDVSGLEAQSGLQSLYASQLATLRELEANEQTPGALADHRKFLASAAKIANSKLSRTAVKKNSYDESDVRFYIESVLINGFRLQPTKLSDFAEFDEAQKLSCWSALISECVAKSEFGKDVFKEQSMQFQRECIASSKTLRELRQAVNGIIPTIEMFRELEALKEENSPEQKAIEYQATMDEMEGLLMQLQATSELAEERKRVLDLVLKQYDETPQAATQQALSISKVKRERKHCEASARLLNIEGAKKQFNLSDSDAAEMFGISRSTLVLLRKEKAKAQAEAAADAEWNSFEAANSNLDDILPIQ